LHRLLNACRIGAISYTRNAGTKMHVVMLMCMQVLYY